MSVGRRGDALTALDDVVHQRTRLAILSILVEAEEADVAYLKRALRLTDGNLGRHLGVLREAGLVEITKEGAGPRSRSWVVLTDVGRERYLAEIDALRRLVERSESLVARVRAADHGGPTGVQPA